MAVEFSRLLCVCMNGYWRLLFFLELIGKIRCLLVNRSLRLDKQMTGFPHKKRLRHNGRKSDLMHNPSPHAVLDLQSFESDLNFQSTIVRLLYLTYCGFSSTLVLFSLPPTLFRCSCFYFFL